MIVNLMGGLDNNSNCKVGLFEVRGVPLKSQVASAMYEIYVRQEWARANDLMGTTTDYTGRRRGGHLRLGLIAGCLS